MTATRTTGPDLSGLTAVAMSGGLDSSVAAWLLAREGVPVIGLSMLLWDHSGVEAHGRCCGALDLGDARRVAAQAGIGVQGEHVGRCGTAQGLVHAAGVAAVVGQRHHLAGGAAELQRARRGHAVVRARAVHHHHLEVAEVLAREGGEARRQVGRRIVGDDGDGDRGRRHDPSSGRAKRAA